MRRLKFYVIKMYGEEAYDSVVKQVDNQLGKHIECLTEFGVTKARAVIEDKQFEPLTMARMLYLTSYDDKQAMRKYNAFRKNVLQCVSSSQWKLIKSYYASIADSSDGRLK